MQIFTSISVILTIVTGIAAFNQSGNGSEVLKLLYAYLALTTVVCALISLAARKPAVRATATVQSPDRVQSSLT